MLFRPSERDLESNHSAGLRAVFLDRDGTLIHHEPHLHRMSNLELFGNSAEAIRLLNARSMPAVLITNQSAVARGLLSEAELADIHREIQVRLQSEGAHLDAVYYCPHHPTEGYGEFRRSCGCRKPEPGLILRACSELEIDPRLSFMVGDTRSDIEAGKRAGCETILISTRSSRQSKGDWIDSPEGPDFVAADILEAVRWIIEERV